MGLLIVGLILLAVVLTEQQLYAHNAAKKLRYTCNFSDTVLNEGDVTELVEQVENEKLLPVPWLKSELTIPEALQPVGGESVVTGKDRFITGFFMVRSYSGIRRVRKIAACRRGIYHIQAARLQTADLLGGIRISLLPESLGHTLTVLPACTDYSQILPQRLHCFDGEQTVPYSIRTNPFMVAGVRPYVSGDAMRQIHWKASAHCQTLMVRQEERVARRRLLVLLNVQTASEQTGTHSIDEALAEHTIRLCMQCLTEACDMGYSVSLRSNGMMPDGQPLALTEVGGIEALEQQRYALAALSVSEQMPLRHFLRDNCCDIPQDTAVLLITPYTDDAFSVWQEQLPEAVVMVSAEGTDAAGIAEAVYPMKKQAEKRGDMPS